MPRPTVPFLARLGLVLVGAVPVTNPAAAQEAQVASAAAVATAPADVLDVPTVLSLALEVNPTLQAALFDAASARADARAAAAARDPSLGVTTRGEYAESVGDTAGGAIRTRGWNLQHGAALTFTSDVGTQVSLSIGLGTRFRQAGLTPGVTTVVIIGPTHTASATLSARQPLLRGAGRDAVLADQRTAEARATSSEASARVASSQLVRDVLVAYWELWYAERALEVQARAVELAALQAARARQEEALGTLAPADVLRFVTTEATLREQLATVTASRTQRVVELARLLAIPVDALATIGIGSAPPSTTDVPSLAALLAGLRSTSPELAALEADLAAAAAAAAAARDAARARLDATAAAGMTGLWMEDAYQGLAIPGGRPAFVASVGLELELPVTTDRRRAQRAAAEADLDAAEARLAAAVAQLEALLVTLHANLRAAIERIPLAAETARVSGQLADAERQRLELGTTTVVVVLDAQQTARESELRHGRALADAAVASLELEHRAGTLLDRFDVVADEGATP